MSAASKYRSSSRVQAQIEQLWTELAHDPAQQALACAALCQDQAPQLAEWLKAKILAEMSDTLFKQLLFAVPLDERIEALNSLAGVKFQPRPKSQPVAIPAPQITRKTKPAHQGLILFGVPIRVVGDAPVSSDPELARLANGLGYAAVFRLWLIGRTLDEAGVGQVAKNTLETELASFGVSHTRRYLNRLLQRGNGLLWAISADGRLLHLRSYEKVAQRLTLLALDKNPDLILTNIPGQKFKTICVAGSIADFEANCLAAWLDSRRDQGMTNIALSTLSALFGHSSNTIRDWLKRAGVQVQHNYTQYAGTDECLVPDHANLYVTHEGGYGVTWQLSNSYTPQPTPERQHKYTPRHVQHECEHLLEEWLTGHPAGDCGTALQSAIGAEQGGGVYRTGKLFFAGADDMRKARKRVYSHLRWHQDTTIPHHILLGFKRGKGIYECVDTEERSTTRLHERDYRAEYQPRHQQHRASYRDYLMEG